MKNSIVRTYTWLLATVLLVACHKDQTTPPVTTVGTMDVNLTYPYQTVTGSFELIISEPGGKVLLDTLAQTNTPVIAALKTNATLVDLTVILDYSSQPVNSIRYNVFVYKGVNPANWESLATVLLPLSYPWAGQTPPSQLFCRNYPASAITDGNIFNSFVFSNGVNNPNTGGVYDAAAHTFMLNYNRRVGLYNYFVLPQLGLYKLFIPNGNSDTLDLSQMDTVNAITFSRPFPFTLYYNGCTFNGITDTTDLTKSVSFIDIFNPIDLVHGDLLFPKTPMQKYEMSISARNSVNDNLYYYGYNTTIPTNLNFPEASSFSVVSQQGDNFSVKFNNPASTTYCLTRVIGSDVFVNIWSSADSTTIHPISFLTNQKSKLLNGVELSDLVPKFFEFHNIPGFPYADYFSYTCNPASKQTHQITTYTSYSRAF